MRVINPSDSEELNVEKFGHRTALAFTDNSAQMEPPPGGDQNQAAKMITIHAILVSLSLIIVSFRFIARANGGKHFGWDDWTMLAALVRSLLTETHMSILMTD